MTPVRKLRDEKEQASLIKAGALSQYLPVGTILLKHYFLVSNSAFTPPPACSYPPAHAKHPPQAICRLAKRTHHRTHVRRPLTKKSQATAEAISLDKDYVSTTQG
ncbi:hypothetical protein [Methylobacillus sp.]|uniref:hypothetical protein n=1 Tax=Methylobacillus sp. TaxID=56818 RepID=UPI0012C6F02B|nr:hypothetical protein [Methylobacillus sp.]MPS49381.1 hypothetical protein [Methylobacillus sp.]